MAAVQAAVSHEAACLAFGSPAVNLVISSNAEVSGKVAELGSAIQTNFRSPPRSPMTPRGKNALLAMESRLKRMEALNAKMGGKLPELACALKELNERKNKLMADLSADQFSPPQ